MQKIFSLCLLLFFASFAWAQTDSLSNKPTVTLAHVGHQGVKPDFTTAVGLGKEESSKDSMLVNLPKLMDSTAQKGAMKDSITTLAGGEKPQFSRFSRQDTSYWYGVAEYYRVFDSLTVNPYRIPGEKFKDTVRIELYGEADTLHKEHDCGSHEWCMPLKDHHVTSAFGQRRYRWHYGTDLRVSIGDTIASVFDGIVRISKYNPGGYGHYVVVRHDNGLETLYGHMSKRSVKVGQRVKAGELLGLAGNTGRSSGPHLHFEVRYQGNAINPEVLFNFSGDTLNMANLEINPSHYKYLKDLKAAKYYRVRSGDSLSRIAVRNRTTVTKLCRLNHISRNKVLRVGMRLRVR